MRLGDPAFLIPSAFFHEHASPYRKGDFWHFSLQASMEAETHDQWSPFRVNTLDLGQKFLDIMRDLKKHQTLTQRIVRIPAEPGLIWLRVVA